MQDVKTKKSCNYLSSLGCPIPFKLTLMNWLETLNSESLSLTHRMFIFLSSFCCSSAKKLSLKWKERGIWNERNMKLPSKVQTHELDLPRRNVTAAFDSLCWGLHEMLHVENFQIFESAHALHTAPVVIETSNLKS